MALEWHCRTERLGSDGVACYSEEYEGTCRGLYCEIQMKRSGNTDKIARLLWKHGRRFFISREIICCIEMQMYMNFLG